MTSVRAKDSAVAILAVAMALCACGQQALAPQAVIDQSDATYSRLVARIMGTADQQRDHQFLLYASAQQELVDCFARHGATYEPAPALEDLPPWRQEMPGGTRFIRETSAARVRADARALMDGELTAAPAYAALNRSGPVDSQAVDASAACTAALPSWPWQPEFANALTEELTVMSNAAERSLEGAEESYLSCAAAAGLDVSRPDDIIATIAKPVQDYAHRADTTAAAAAVAREPGWATTTNRATQLFLAEAQCRERGHGGYLNAFLPRLEAFVAEHAEEVAAVEAQWTALHDRAAKARASWYARFPQTRVG